MAYFFIFIRPQDVYSGVVELVNKRIAEDARAGVPEAEILLGKVDRKVIKQTVMTSVYGVTLVGMHELLSRFVSDMNTMFNPFIDDS